MPRPDRPALPPRELGARLDGILACAEKLVASLSVGALDQRVPRGDGQVRDLAFQVFRRGLAYVDGMDMGALPAGWLEERAPADLIDGPAIARYGALVRGRVSGWFEGAAEMTGVKQHRVVHDLCIVRGDAECRRQLSWSK